MSSLLQDIRGRIDPAIRNYSRKGSLVIDRVVHEGTNTAGGEYGAHVRIMRAGAPFRGWPYPHRHVITDAAKVGPSAFSSITVSGVRRAGVSALLIYLPIGGARRLVFKFETNTPRADDLPT